MQIVLKKLEHCDRDIGPGIEPSMYDLFDGVTVRNVQEISDNCDYEWRKANEEWYIHKDWILLRTANEKWYIHKDWILRTTNYFDEVLQLFEEAI